MTGFQRWVALEARRWPARHTCGAQRHKCGAQALNLILRRSVRRLPRLVGSRESVILSIKLLGDVVKKRHAVRATKRHADAKCHSTTLYGKATYEHDLEKCGAQADRTVLKPCVRS